MSTWLLARFGTLIGVTLVALVALGTIALAPGVAQILDRMPWLIYMYTGGASVSPASEREIADPLPFETAGTTTDELRSLGIPVGAVPEFAEVDRNTLFPAGHFMTDAANEQMVLSARRAVWSWATGTPGLGLEVMIVEMPTVAWAESLARIYAEAEPQEGVYPPTATEFRESGSLEDGTVFEHCGVLFTHDRLWVAVQFGLGPDFLSAVEAGEVEPVDVCDSAREVSLAVNANLPALDELKGWEGLETNNVRLLNASSLGVAAALTILVRGLGATILDRGSREAVVGRFRRSTRRSEREIEMIGPTRRMRARSFVGTVVLAAASGAGMIALYFVTGVLGLVEMFLLTGAIVVAGVILSALVRRSVRRGGADLSGGWRVWEVVASATSAVIVAGGIFFIGTAGIGFTIGDADIVRIVSLVMLVLGLAVVGFAPYPARLFRRLAMPAVKKAMARDPRAPILLLRSFQDDDLRVRIHPGSREGVTERLALLTDSTFEDLVAWVVSRRGPVIAIGQPGTLLQPLGAARDYFSDDDWQTEVLKRITTAAAVVFVVGRSPGAQWELAQLRDRGALGKAVFVFPPVSAAEWRKRCIVLSAGLHLDPAELLGAHRGAVQLVAMRIDESGNVVKYVADGRDDVSYTLALEHAIDAAVASRAVVSRVAAEHTSKEIAGEANGLLTTFEPRRSRIRSSDPFRRAFGFVLDLSGRFL